MSNVKTGGKECCEQNISMKRSTDYDAVLKELQVIIDSHAMSFKPWPPYPTMWDWTDELCIDAFRHYATVDVVRGRVLIANKI